MADLAQAIVSMSSAARGRAEARRTLLESAATVARASVQHLRVGDEISVPSDQYRTGGSIQYSVEKLGWKVLDSSRLETAKVLCRSGLPLHDERAGSYVGDSYLDPDDPRREVDLPKPANLIAFSREAHFVIAAFTRLLDDEQRELAAAARELATLRPTTGKRPVQITGSSK